MKHDFQYISKRSPKVHTAYEDLMALLADVRKELKGKYTFQHKIIGSYARNMITCDHKGNTGYDFDVNIYPNDNDEDYTAKELMLSLKQALDRCGAKYGYSPAEGSTRVLTIKVKDRAHSRILYSVDFAIVYDYEDDCGEHRQRYIRNNKKHGSYTWEKQSAGYYMLPEKIEWIKAEGLWQQVRDRYIDKKNSNDDPNVHSRALFANAVHEVCQKNGYWQPKTCTFGFFTSGLAPFGRSSL